jgi:hypothetical protein
MVIAHDWAVTVGFFESALQDSSPGTSSAACLPKLAGLGMHLRGLDRQMGGLYVWLFSLLEGPPAWAPALFTGFAAVGLIAIYLI